MADYQQNFLASLGAGYNFGQQIKQQRDQSQLNQLASLAYGAAPEQRMELGSKIASLSPDAAQAQRKAWDANDERDQRELMGMARFIKAAPPEQQQNAYEKAIRPQLIARGMQAPNWTPETRGTILQTVDALAQLYPGANGGTIQSQKISDDGYIINTYRDGRMEKTQQKVDRQMWLRDHPGMASPELVGKDGSVLQVGQDASGSLPQGGLDVGAGSGRVRMNIEGIAPERQTRIAQTVSMMQQANYPEDEIEQFIQAQIAQPVTNIGAPRQTFSRPSAAQDAADSARAKIGVENANFENELEQQRRLKEQEARIDTDKAAAVEQAKSEQERASNERAKTAQLNNVDRGLTRIDEAMKKLTRGLIDTGPIDGRLMVSTPQGQELEAAVGAIQNDMLALTRVPGIGSQSDLEAKIANLKYPSIYNHPSVNAANVQQLKAFMEDLRSQITGSPAQGGRTVVRTGTSNGRKVIQYSDGSVEYGN